MKTSSISVSVLGRSTRSSLRGRSRPRCMRLQQRACVCSCITTDDRMQIITRQKFNTTTTTTTTTTSPQQMINQQSQRLAPKLYDIHHHRQPTTTNSLFQRSFSSSRRHHPSSSSSSSSNPLQTSEEDATDDPHANHDNNIPSCLLPYTGLPSHPDSIELEPGQRLVAIGDVHGDFEQLLNALLLAQVVAEEGNDDTLDEQQGGGDGARSFVWVGGNTIVVQIGDILDRGPHELPCWQLLADLSRQAQSAGGRIIHLFGNHELWTSIGFYQLDQERYLENIDYDDGIDDHFETEFGKHLEKSLEELEEDWRDARLLNDLVSSGIMLHPRKVSARWAAMEPGGLLAKHFLANFKIAVKVGETVLVHAGMVPEHLDRFGGIEGMNEATRNWILKQGQPRVGRTAMIVPPNDPEGRLRTYVQSMPDFFMEGDDNAYSPIWMREYSDPPDDVPHSEDASDMLETVLNRLNAKRMVIGHTPQSRINAIMNGKAWRIDVAMSRGMCGTYPEVLEVVKDDKGEETVWVVTAEGKLPAEERYVLDHDHADHPSASNDGS